MASAVQRSSLSEKFLYPCFSCLLHCFKVVYDFCSKLCGDGENEEQDRLHPQEGGTQRKSQAQIKIFEDDVKEKRSARDRLLRQKNEFRMRFFPEYECLSELQVKKNGLCQGKSKDLESSYIDIIERLLEIVEGYLHNLLLPKEVTRHYDEKEQYRVYGLLLSASSIRDCFDHDSTEDSNEKVLSNVRGKHRFIQRHQFSIKENVQHSLAMTHSMLTLLPPLLVTQPYHYYEEIQDTNRVTWDERKREPLIYYRPVLVYGNHLHVAIKGLVGNSETVVPDEGGRGGLPSANLIDL